ncbi:MAG: hypothetical protein ACPGU1_22295 [Myxococcota bacterium]
MMHIPKHLMLALALLLCAPPVDAFQCARRPALQVVGLTSFVSTKVHIYLQEDLSEAEWKHVRLIDSKSKRAIRFERLEAPLRITPTKALTPGHRYGLWFKDRRMKSFRTLDKEVTPVTPALSVVFSEARTPDPNEPDKTRGYEGRSASIVSNAKRKTAPAVLVVSARLWPTGGDDDDPTVLEHVIPYRTKAEFASTQPCQATSTPAPNQGRYTVTVTPWWSDGHQGEAVTLTGKIR